MNIDDQQEEAAVEMILAELAREIHGFAGVRMHRLNVCEWEVKLWVSSSGQANGSWRVVVTNMTGHTCTVHVSTNVVLPFNNYHEWHLATNSEHEHVSNPD